jgi:hypothetical protein
MAPSGVVVLNKKSSISWILVLEATFRAPKSLVRVLCCVPNKLVGEEAKLVGDEAKLVGEEAKLVGEEAKLVGEEAKLVGDD